ncbi:unnamed protein product [Staphylococcus haemolyticus JCSC1435]|uniref:Uncharacterized protein n=1 Tax=Staphylococcus haemolyticus (strain JCSC1435) TaxID=279808 RepID=Q4L7I1_STAHJ|nr:unnamed protein product [Staphylococcus haemolyticus JCSC1435]
MSFLGSFLYSKI